MDLEALGRSPVGRLVDIAGTDHRTGRSFAHKAFLPDPLPDEVSLRSGTVLAVMEASRAVAELDRIASELPNPLLVVRPAIRREAVSTSALEGTYAAFTEVLEAEFLEEGQLTSSVAEVFNYVRAAEYAFAWAGSGRPLTVGLLGDLQGMLVHGTRGGKSDAGRVRTIQVLIGGGTGGIEQARFVPPPPGGQLEAGLAEWVGWVGRDNPIPSVVKMALGHYQFETLHPFADGNGRLGRLLCVLQLAWREELRVPVLNLSPWLEERRREYQDHLLRCSQTGDFDPWVAFFSRAVTRQAVQAVERIEALLATRDLMLTELKEQKVRGVAMEIAEELIGYPVITVTAAAERYGVTYAAANNAVRRLVDAGVLRELTGRRYGRAFAAPRILALLES